MKHVLHAYLKDKKKYRFLFNTTTTFKYSEIYNTSQWNTVL